jgi:hypothetical protein
MFTWNELTLSVLPVSAGFWESSGAVVSFLVVAIKDGSRPPAMIVRSLPFPSTIGTTTSVEEVAKAKLMGAT